MLIEKSRTQSIFLATNDSPYEFDSGNTTDFKFISACKEGDAIYKNFTKQGEYTVVFSVEDDSLEHTDAGFLGVVA